MIVAELMAWLLTQDPSAKVVIHDADTDWFLDLKTGAKDFSMPDEIPAGCVCVHGDYYDEDK